MNKAILLSIKPKWVAKILNGEKTIEVRKVFPKDYVGWVYIYCSKGEGIYLYDMNHEEPLLRNGKVVARFWCDKVSSIGFTFRYDFPILSTWSFNKLTNLSCLSSDQLLTYLDGKKGYAIHITRLEIFDEPKELREFRVRRTCTEWHYNADSIGEEVTFEILPQLKKAPQNYCYIEEE